MWDQVRLSRSFLSGKLDVKVGVNDIFHDAGYRLSMNANVLKSYGYSRYDSRRGVVSVYYKFGKKVMPARERSGATETEQGRLNL
ncbi:MULTISPECIES: hypothetical protein [unclassified Chitinophaga]|uniref:hypothetical protein n=1 Tax=unclassified Chitinophaga TaxID=2619133 RepID=UPI0009D5AD62|nr:MULTISPECIES: hypothetical protein [unclassified Chitinophaga]OMP76770.1 hypothetical protein BW716_23550 [[Flexibacter] sp. ATCC 35208]WPV70504.1 hypothetical protein QQL36_17490 [Chitinophaga sp. LS1]